MKRINWIPLWIALAAAPLVFLLQHVVRPSVPSISAAWLLLGPVPSLIVGTCVPFIVVARLPRSPTSAARAFTLTTLATLGAQVLIEVTRLIPGADTFDIMDVVASVAGMLLGAMFYRRVAPHLRYDTQHD